MLYYEDYAIILITIIDFVKFKQISNVTFKLLLNFKNKAEISHNLLKLLLLTRSFGSISHDYSKEIPRKDFFTYSNLAVVKGSEQNFK